MTKRKKSGCEGCKWWSERIARCIGLGPMEALCLCDESKHRQRMVHAGCDKKEVGTPVDDPSFVVPECEVWNE